MNAAKLMEELIQLSTEKTEDTVDTCKAGDPNRELHKVALCCTATPDIIRQAHTWGADLLITHEPTYHDHYDHLSDDDPIALEKKAFIESTGMTIYRYHDHAHSNQPDSIAMGELEELGWEKERFDGRFGLILSQPRTAKELAKEIEEKLGITHVKMVGKTDFPVKKICFCVGAWDMLQKMKTSDADLFVSGELSEWQACEYIRDSVELGHQKALLVLGHIASEKAGMKYVEKLVKKIDPSLETKYLDCPEIFSYNS